MPKRPEDFRRTVTAERVKARVTSTQVADYLRRHPDFLARHPDLLEFQIMPARRRGQKVVDLQQFMVERLRQDVARLRADQDDILANSRDNLSTQDRVHKAMLALLEARDFDHFIETFSTDLLVLLDVDTVALCIEVQDRALPWPATEGIRLVAPGTVDAEIGPGAEVLLRDDATGDAAIFGEGAGLVRSDALVRLSLGQDKLPGLMGFGTRHPGYFNPGQGTELLTFLARIVEYCMTQWTRR